MLSGGIRGIRVVLLRFGDELRDLRPRFGGFPRRGERGRRGVTVGGVQTDPWMAEAGTRY